MICQIIDTVEITVVMVGVIPCLQVLNFSSFLVIFCLYCLAVFCLQLLNFSSFLMIFSDFHSHAVFFSRCRISHLRSVATSLSTDSELFVFPIVIFYLYGQFFSGNELLVVPIGLLLPVWPVLGLPVLNLSSFLLIFYLCGQFFVFR